MDYEQKYKNALERAKQEIWACWSKDCDAYRQIIRLFPELKESEDERIRKAIVEFFELQDDNTTYSFIPKKDIIAWLEKQESVGEIVLRCKTSWYNEGKIQGQIEGLSDEEKYQQGWHDAFEKQGEFKGIDSDDLAILETWEDFIKENKEKWQLNDWFVEATSLLIQKVKHIENNKNINIKDSRVTLNACINALRTDGHSHLSDWLEKQDQVKEYTFKSLPRLLDMIEPSDKAKAYCRKLMDALVKEGYATDAKIVGECLEKMNGEDVPMATMDEKQGEQKPADKIEPKFKVGDWIIFNGFTLLVNEVVQGYYRTISIDGLHNSYDWNIDNMARLWTIKEARSGDVLASKDKLSIVIFRNLDTSTSFSSYYNIEGKGELGWSNECFIPATKEQRNVLFSKMKEAGYEWDAEKKEPRKIKQNPAWSEEDEQGYEDVDWCIRKALQACNNEDETGTCWFAQRWVNSIKQRLGGGE